MYRAPSHPPNRDICGVPGWASQIGQLTDNTRDCPPGLWNYFYVPWHTYPRKVTLGVDLEREPDIRWDCGHLHPVVVGAILQDRQDAIPAVFIRREEDSIWVRSQPCRTLHDTAHEATMPKTGTNRDVGGKPSTGGPSRIDDNATGARSKDPNNRGTTPNKHRVKESPEGGAPRKTPRRERYALLVGVEVSPQPGARPSPRSVPSHAWKEQIIWDYVEPAIPELTNLVVLNPMEFHVFRGSRSAGKVLNLDEAALASAGLHDTRPFG